MSLIDEPINIAYPDALYLGGEWRKPSSDKSFTLINPATEEAFFTVAAGAEADVDAAVAAARHAFDHGPWPRMSPSERADYMVRLADALDRRARELAHCWTRQMGAVFASATLPNTPWSISFLRSQAAMADQVAWKADKDTMFPGSEGMLVAEPVGVVAAIAPWNGPLFLLNVKLAPALMAGCTVVIKPAPETPLETFILCECAKEIGLPDGVINLLPADNEVSNYLVLHPGIDKVSFTGSTAAGRKIASQMGQRIGRVTLELGGKSAAIILDDYDIEAAVAQLAPTITSISGQFCTNLTRILVSNKRKADFVEAMKAGFEAIKVGDPYDPDNHMGPLAAKRHFDRVAGYVEKGLAEGGTLVTGGGKPAGLDRGYYFAPTLFTDVDSRATIAQEEVFGPFACVIGYEDEADAVRIANDSIYGLAGSVFTNHRDAAYRIARQVRTGTIAQNGLKFDFGIAFGGFKQSGLGREGGAEGIRHYLELKTIILDEPVSA